MTEVTPAWLHFVQRIQAIAQSGLAFSDNPYDIERYELLLDLAAQMAATYTGGDVEMLRGLFRQDQGYATPKVDVRGVVFQEDTILLVKERIDGKWTLPGGFADVGDSPAEATVREVYEESGFQSRAVKLLAAYDRNKQGHPPYAFHLYKLFFLCEIISGEATPSYETTEVGFFALDKLPPLSLGRVTEKQIARFFEHYRNPDWPTDFD